ncbi:MAG: LCP family protein [Chloroflexota bacterium]|nr:LCP family protein [Chloroflexota bacterium]
MTAERAQGTPRSRSTNVAALLSFLWPGVGQWYRGRWRAGLLYAVPVALVAGAALSQVVGGAQDLALELFAPSFSLTILILIILLGLWRLLSMFDAGTPLEGWRRAGRRTGSVFAALALVVVVVHGVAAYYAWSFYDAGSHIFVNAGTEPPIGTDDRAQGPLVALPYVTPATRASRINVLLTGVDSAAGRSHALNDTLILASIDPVSHKVAMLSFPRDIANFPLWNGHGMFTGKINSLMSYARQHPKEFPDGDLGSLIKELGYLIGAPIHYYAAVDLDGFRRLIDKAGGVDVNNSRAIDDPVYGGWTDKRPIGFTLSAGMHHLDGQTALAFVRSRKGPGDTDFSRARRQQQLLVALTRKLADPAMLPRLPDILTVAGGTVRTNFPSDRLGEMISLSRDVPDNQITQVVLGPPYARRPVTSIAIYTLEIDFAKFAALSIKIFGTDSAYVGLAPGTSPPPTN